jgi:hypothetical protein
MALAKNHRGPLFAQATPCALTYLLLQSFQLLRSLAAIELTWRIHFLAI